MSYSGDRTNQTLTVPLTVRLSTSRKDMDITGQVADVRFRSTAPGGFASAQITLNRPLDTQPDEIEYFGKLYIYDGRNGETIWEGRLEDPGRTASDAGEVWNITCVGPSAHTKDRSDALIYVDTMLDRWVRGSLSTGGAQTQTSEIDSDTPSLQVRASEGSSVTTSWQGDWIYRNLWWAGQKIGRVRANMIAESANANYQGSLYVRVNGGTATTSYSKNWDIVEDTLVLAVGSAGFTGDENVVNLRAARSVTNVTANSLAGIQFYNIVVRAQIMDKTGADITDPTFYAGDNFINTTEVIGDLLGRRLTKFDGANAIISGSGVDIHQIAYPDSVTADEVLADLAVFDPAYYWAAWETNPATGKYRFEYIPWPTTVRYEATTLDGGDFPATAGELFNRVTVRWLDKHSKIRTLVRTQSVQVLTDAGLTRQDFIDISDEIGDATNAQIVGDNFLAEHKYPPNAGTLTVARPILDNLTGRMVYPWEILPGHLIRVQGVLPRVDSLNPSNRDGVTVFRVLSVEYSADAGVAVLELDSYSRTVARALSRIRRRSVTRKR